jgi:hypothetical protein
MKRPLTPQEKKAFAYTKDHFDPSAYPHAFRRKWPKKKARAQRRYRRQVKQVLDSSAARNTDGWEEQTRVAEIRKKKPSKWKVLSLEDWLGSRRWRRAGGAARRLYDRLYDSDKHRERYRAFLATLPKNPDVFGPELADVFELMMMSPIPIPLLRRGIYMSPHRHVWLENFFQDEPDWKLRLSKWMDEMQSIRSALR